MIQQSLCMSYYLPIFYLHIVGIFRFPNLESWDIDNDSDLLFGTRQCSQNDGNYPNVLSSEI